ncbi:MAG: hypothetical protein RBR63_12700 [Methanosarcina vacuolata]|jgi:hypothetical protein|nr:hypothetical protein [Methanosarcina vacuolata]
MDTKSGLKPSLFKKSLTAILFKKNLTATLFKKGLTENHEPIFGFDELIPKPYRRDHNPFQKRLDRKP